MKNIITVLLIFLVSYLTLYLLTNVLNNNKTQYNINHQNIKDSLIIKKKHIPNNQDYYSLKDSILKIEINSRKDTLQNTEKYRKNNIPSEKIMLEDINNALIYLSKQNKKRDILLFHQKRLKKHYKIKGLSKGINLLLNNSIKKLTKEIKIKNKKLSTHKKDTTYIEKIDSIK